LALRIFAKGFCYDFQMKSKYLLFFCESADFHFFVVIWCKWC